MESTVTFKSTQDNCYIYDNTNSCLLNCHPILNEIISVVGSNETDIFSAVCKQFPMLTQEVFDYYYNKYLFLKDNGLFQTIDVQKKLSGRISSQMVEQQIANVNDIVFQVTNQCNLSCVYCCYGDLYENEGRDILHSVMDFSTAKKMMDYLVEKWNSNRNLSHNGYLLVGFYGGEPLTNFPLIEQIVAYTKTLHLNNQAVFRFNMTTNCMLLDRYMDFLVEHDFKLLLSLDGNEIHNSLRVDKSGKSSFKQVYRNIKKLQQTHPDYFERSVSFNSVLNKHSNVAEVYQFIADEFGKNTQIETISYSGVKETKKKEFFDIYRNYEIDTVEAKDLELKKRIRDAGFFFYYHIGNAYRHFVDLIGPDKKKMPKIPTGTCLPFRKKIFVTPGGGLYACERIGFEHILGKIGDEVEINPEAIAEKYNRCYEAIVKQCVHCYQADSCPACIMQFRHVDGKPVCPTTTNKQRFKEYLSDIISYLETLPDIYNKVNKMVFA